MAEAWTINNHFFWVHIQFLFLTFCDLLVSFLGEAQVLPLVPPALLRYLVKSGKGWRCCGGFRVIWRWLVSKPLVNPVTWASSFEKSPWCRHVSLTYLLIWLLSFVIDSRITANPLSRRFKRTLPAPSVSLPSCSEYSELYVRLYGT